MVRKDSLEVQAVLIWLLLRARTLVFYHEVLFND